MQTLDPRPNRTWYARPSPWHYGGVARGRIGLVTGTVALLTIVAAARPSVAQESESWLDRAEIGGVAFGDAYWMAAHHDETVEGANGFWLRRLYLTFDYDLAEDLDFRARFEGGSPGDFTSGGKIEPTVKDLWVRWRGSPHAAVTVGLSSTPTWALVEDVWGYRDVAKTPLDMHGFNSSSRDFGVGLAGRIDDAGRFRYRVMLGNGAGTGTETNQGKKVYGSLSYHHPAGLVLEAYGDYEAQPSDRHVATLQGFAGWRGEGGRLGAHLVRQHREDGAGSSRDFELASAFGVLEMSDRVNLLARYDRLFDPNPDAPGVDYLVLSSRGETNIFLGGLDVAVAERFHLIPNVEVVAYSDTDPGAEVGTDVMLRTTFSATF